MPPIVKGELWSDPTGKWATVKVLNFGPDWILVSDPNGTRQRHVGPKQLRAMTDGTRPLKES